MPVITQPGTHTEHGSVHGPPTASNGSAVERASTGGAWHHQNDRRRPGLRSLWHQRQSCASPAHPHSAHAHSINININSALGQDASSEAHLDLVYWHVRLENDNHEDV